MDPIAIAPRPPIGFFALTAASFKVVKKNVHAFALISVIPLVFLGTATVILSSVQNSGGFILASIVSVIGLLCVIGALFFKVLFPVVMTRAIEAADGDLSKSADIDVAGLYRKSFADFWPYLLVGVLVLASVIFGTFIVVIPGVIAATYYGFAIFTYAFQGKRGSDALVASSWLVRGRMLDVFQRMVSGGLLVAVAMLIVAAILQLFIRMAGFDDMVGSFIFDLFVAMFILPFVCAYGYYLYRDLALSAGNEIDPAFAKKSKMWLTILTAIGAVLMISFPILIAILMSAGKLIIIS